jgi:hypothetical protein
MAAHRRPSASRDCAFRIGNEQAKGDLLSGAVKLGGRFLMNKTFHGMHNRLLNSI